jgi:hypothetical protein
MRYGDWIKLAKMELFTRDFKRVALRLYRTFFGAMRWINRS